jgi:hypothetical protein
LLPSMKGLATRVRDFLAAPVLDAVRRVTASNAEIVAALNALRPITKDPDPVAQVHLMLTYRRLLDERRPLPPLSEVGFKCYSQTDEDGILLFLFSVLGAGDKLCVEVCAGDGIECNTANLILCHGWHGLLVDAIRRE